MISFLVSGHYRQPLEFSSEAMAAAAARLDRIRNFLVANPPEKSNDGLAATVQGGSPIGGLMAGFRAALADDFNTPRALAEMFELIGKANREPVSGAPEAVAEMCRLLGLEEVVVEAGRSSDAGDDAERLLAEREEARAERDFARADAIRDELAELGYEVRDGADGARLVRIG